MEAEGQNNRKNILCGADDRRFHILQVTQVCEYRVHLERPLVYLRDSRWNSDNQLLRVLLASAAREPREAVKRAKAAAERYET